MVSDSCDEAVRTGAKEFDAKSNGSLTRASESVNKAGPSHRWPMPELEQVVEYRWHCDEIGEKKRASQHVR